MNEIILNSKICPGCKIRKDFNDYWSNKSKHDGKDHYCKSCRKEFSYKNDLRESTINKRAIYRSKDSAKALAVKRNQKYESKNRIKKNAHQMVAYYLKNGVISKKNCEICGSELVEAHHEDYSKPLDVRWLCRKHHRDAHRAMA